MKFEVDGQTITAPGLYEGIDADAYHRAPGVSKSQLDTLASRTPAHLAYDREHPESRTETPQMALGTAVHCALLEPLTWSERYVEMPEFSGKGSVAARNEWKAAHAGQIALPTATMQQVAYMVDAVSAHPTAWELLKETRTEVSGWWVDPETEHLCRLRADGLQQKDVCVDLKTTNDASPSGFARTAANFRYHVAAAGYSRGLNEIDGFWRDYVFIVVERDPPYGVACYELADEDLALGHRLAMRDLQVYAQCAATKIWPSYSADVETLRLPAWARYMENQTELF